MPLSSAFCVEIIRLMSYTGLDKAHQVSLIHQDKNRAHFTRHNKWLVPMEVSYRDLRDHKIIILKGEMDYFSNRELRDIIFKLIYGKTKNIILDLKDVTFIDSAGMGLLISVNKELNKYNKKLGLLNLSEGILNLIKLATLDQIIEIHHNEDTIK